MKNIIEKKRKELNLSQSALAKRIGISQQHLDRYEKGYPIPLEKVRIISKELAISKWDLLPDDFRKTDTNDIQTFKEILFDILMTVEKWLHENKYELDSEDKINLIFALYERVAQTPKEHRTAKIIDFTDFLYKNRKVG